MKKPLLLKLIEFAQRNAVAVIVAAGAITAVLAFFAARINVNPQIMDLLPERTELNERIKKYSGDEPRGEYYVVAVESANPFRLDRLAALAIAIERIQVIEYVGPSITPFNLMSFRREGTRLELVPMTPGGAAPRTQEEADEFRERLADDSLARNLVVSADMTSLAAIFQIELLEDYGPVFAQVEPILDELGKYYAVYSTGPPLIEHVARSYLLRDLPKLLGIAVVLFMIMYFVGFRTKRAVYLPIMTVGMGTIWTIGVMSLLNMSMTLVSMIIPPLVLTLGSSYSIHVLNQYYRDAPAEETSREWIARAVHHITKTILIAAATTAIGFGSLWVSGIKQIAAFGVGIVIGVIICAGLSLFFFPAALTLLPPPTTGQRSSVVSGLVSRLMGKLGSHILTLRYPALGLLVAIAVAFGLTVGYTRYETDYTTYFKKKEGLVVGNDFVYGKYGGFIPVYITLTAPEQQPGYFLDSKVLERIARFESELGAYSDIADVRSFTSFLRRMNLALFEQDEIPRTRAPILLLSRYLRAYSSLDEGASLGPMINDDFSQYTITIRVHDSERKGALLEEKFAQLLEFVDTRIAADLDPRTTPEVWGISMVGPYLSDILRRSQLTSAILSLVLIFAVTSVAFRSAWLGLCSLVPMISGIMLNFVFTAVFRIPLDVVTVMMASILIGLGVDDSIHMLIQYRRQKRIWGDDMPAILVNTLQISGRPILLTSISLIMGFLALAFSSFKPILYFGILISVAIFTTTVSALVFLPSLLSLEYRKKGRPKPKQDSV